ncbi:MAG: hypothetical protein IJH78_09100 [Clostridia bacterium]|nr:hypothetical protein [Clostridia bacterium]
MAAKIKEQMILQYDGRDVKIDELSSQIKAAWKEAGNKLADIQTLDIYVKPQEGKAYYVINKTIEGVVDL